MSSSPRAAFDLGDCLAPPMPAATSPSREREASSTFLAGAGDLCDYQMLRDVPLVHAHLRVTVRARSRAPPNPMAPAAAHGPPPRAPASGVSVPYRAQPL